MSSFARVVDFFLDLLFPLTHSAEIVRGTSHEELGALVSPRIVHKNIIALLPYRHRRVRAAIWEAKFHKNPRALTMLGNVLREYVEELTRESAELDPHTYILVPIPLGKKRQQERGYNQVEEILRASGVRTESLLVRSNETEAQSRLTRRKRQKNVAGAFTLQGSPNPSHTYILVDDVTTTGTTLHEAVSVLPKGTVILALAH